jgi:hypothetical protein
MSDKLIIYNSDNNEIHLEKLNITHYYSYQNQKIKIGYVNGEITEIFLFNNMLNVIRIGKYYYKFPYKTCYDILGSDTQLIFLTKNYIRKKKILNL